MSRLLHSFPPLPMPGPSNVKKKRKSQGKAPKEKPAQILAPVDYGLAGSSSTSFDSQDQSGSPGSPLSRSQSPTQPLTPPHPHTLLLSPEKEILLQDDDHEGALTQIQFTPQVPFIHDPGNGPRVRDTRAFLTSKYFSQPPALDVRMGTAVLCVGMILIAWDYRYRYVLNLRKKRCCRC